MGHIEALLYVIQASPEGAIQHVIRHRHADTVIVAVPAPPTRAALLAYHEIRLVATRLGYQDAHLIQLPVANPPLATHEAYKAVRDYNAIHALINAPPAMAIPVYTALLLHALTNNARITITLATLDPQQPYTTLTLDPVTTIITGRGLASTRARIAHLLLQEGRTTPTRAAQHLNISKTTAEKHLRWLRNKQLANQAHGNIYTPTPWLKLHHEIHWKQAKSRKA
ncbi:hypothetical protein Pyrfu_0502 [Pyrolobus fumarii 1A]|uniref:HTH deoR-type domain-containing protein n=1 Tax=Pyrolobus fumarii (strain DSM 11204 / 1A) TaxID=694429 RepID=G0EGJ9_PYRF1|nr:DeoR family transcriptional regulator [Pyrolobus fumarii]AEM38373.1 hypothetical protein Pyrfu_0502 [Pyrolobus fumarii 1A]